MPVPGIVIRANTISPCPVTPSLCLQRLLQKRLTHELQRYFLVSVMAFGMDLGVLLLLKEGFQLHYLSAAALGFLSGMVIAYVSSIRWVFRFRRQTDWRREFVLFAGIGLCGLVLNEGVMWAVTDGLDFNYSGSKLIAAGCVFLFNFCMRKTLLFTPEEQ